MFCPFLSCGKDAVVECRTDCALYNGTLNGHDKACSIFSICVDTGTAIAHLKSLEKSIDKIEDTVYRIESTRPGS